MSKTVVFTESAERISHVVKTFRKTFVKDNKRSDRDKVGTTSNHVMVIPTRHNSLLMTMMGIPNVCLNTGSDVILIPTRTSDVHQLSRQ